MILMCKIQRYDTDLNLHPKGPYPASDHNWLCSVHDVKCLTVHVHVGVVLQTSVVGHRFVSDTNGIQSLDHLTGEANRR